MTDLRDDRVRGFPAFPAGRRRSGRARSWWGDAWIAALEETALDPAPLGRGRRYATSGRVGAITVSPGRLAAAVHDEHGAEYRTVVAVAELSDTDWHRFLDEVAARAGHVAALLERDMPHDLVAAAADAGVPLLPAVGDLDPECDCPEWDLPCRHAAALCYQAARLLDEDPFVLLLLRGRGERELLAELERRGAGVERSGPAVRPVRAAPAAGEGEPARLAYARALPPLPAPLTGSPPARRPLAVPEAPGVDPADLDRLAADAAARARDLLAAAEVAGQ
ncbi:SWIM zinc finger family protein [Marinitenerispora sediminis]|uniref:SWIM-type domain-containing protein n=1 Tax=Marinitenerispora sediminis TaxID=1931232 RepID=A0A368TAN4_9ACTN|nr:SWIM zinc finger family protein [Marinitenerispora sediminis]RCV53373.1 hypothetical protein DEF28_10440 [Marinitenerispora sediminis]RCV58430.1 hypothetical protein DEF23_08925 [Marinitenerispora sediminis]RCV61789.1 hypothetical protein DEF24_03440 [Marinitenerispora sediminis]